MYQIEYKPRSIPLTQTAHTPQTDHNGKPNGKVAADGTLQVEPFEKAEDPPIDFATALRPKFRKKSYFIGMMHGLAGSAAVMLVLLPEIDSAWVGIGYLTTFGVGTMASMALITLVIGAPFAFTRRFKAMDGAVSSVAGGASLLFGVALMADLALGTTLVPF